MTDKEIYQLVVSTQEMAQQREALHVMQAKLLHRRIDGLLQLVSLQGQLAELPAGEDRDQMAKQLAGIIDRDEIPGQTRKLVAMIESQHELAEALLDTLRTRIESL